MTKEIYIFVSFRRISFKSLFAKGGLAIRVPHTRQSRMTHSGVYSHVNSFSILVLNEKQKGSL